MTNYQTEHSFNLSADGARDFLDIYRDWNAWRSVAYLFLAFPLGVAYFVALVTGVSLGGGLAITLIGIPLLIAVFYVAGWATQFEAWLANRLIDADVTPTVYEYDVNDGLFARLGAALGDGRRWKGIAFLFLRFPLGIMSFVLTMIAVSLPLSMITAPLTFWTNEIEIVGWTVNTLPEALLASVLGVFAGAVGLRVISWAASVWRVITVAMLSEDGSKRKNDEKPKNEMLAA